MGITPPNLVKGVDAFFPPIAGICFVHFNAIRVFFNNTTSWTNHFEQLSYLLCIMFCILKGFLAIKYLYCLSAATIFVLVHCIHFSTLGFEYKHA